MEFSFIFTLRTLPVEMQRFFR